MPHNTSCKLAWEDAMDVYAKFEIKRARGGMYAQ